MLLLTIGTHTPCMSDVNLGRVEDEGGVPWDCYRAHSCARVQHRGEKSGSHHTCCELLNGPLSLQSVRHCI